MSRNCDLHQFIMTKPSSSRHSHEGATASTTFDNNNTTTPPSPTRTVTAGSEDDEQKKDAIATSRDDGGVDVVGRLERGQGDSHGGDDSSKAQQPKATHWLQETEHVIPKNNLWIVFSGLMFSVYL